MAHIYGKPSTIVFMDNEGKDIINYYKRRNRYVKLLKIPFLKNHYISKLKNLGVLTDEQKTWFIGFVGERKILDVLKKLNNKHHVFCSLIIDDYELDFVVVGPRGVFMIEAKNHGKTEMKYHTKKSGIQCNLHGIALHFFLRDHSLPCNVSNILVNKRKKFHQAKMPERVISLSPRDIHRFIMRKPQLSNNDMSKIVSLLKTRV